MTWVDAVVLAVLVVSAGVAFFRGLVREVLSVGAWVGAVVAAFALEPVTVGIAARYVDVPWAAAALSIAVVFVIALIVLKLLTHWVAGRVQRSMLGGVDRALGLVFGLARGAAIVVLAYIVGGLVVPAAEQWPDAVRQARSLPLTADGARWAVDHMPPEFRPRLPEGMGSQDPSLDQLLRPPARSR